MLFHFPLDSCASLILKNMPNLRVLLIWKRFHHKSISNLCFFLWGLVICILGLYPGFWFFWCNISIVSHCLYVSTIVVATWKNVSWRNIKITRNLPLANTTRVRSRLSVNNGLVKVSLRTHTINELCMLSLKKNLQIFFLLQIMWLCFVLRLNQNASAIHI